MDLPKPFIVRMEGELKEEFPDFLRCFGEPPAKGVRVNLLKLSAEEFAALAPFPLGEKVPWAADGFYTGEERPGAFIEHFAGLYYCQEPSAMCAAPLLQAQPKERVLDLCAAPGGKTTQLAAAMAGEGVLVANEYIFDRAKILSQNVERLGLKNCAVVSASAAELADALPAYFDKVLVDAPCSGEGMFRKDPAAIAEWSEENVLRCIARQRDILDGAARLVRAGGRLVYSTCTFARGEDEGQAEDFLCRHPEFELLEQHRLMPHKVRGEGHFAALFAKRGAEEPCKPRPFPVRRDRAAEKAWREFASDFFVSPPEGTLTTLADGRMYLLPEGLPALPGRVLRAGVELGEYNGKRFTPAHALAMSAKRGEVRRFVSLERAAAEQYLHGEALAAETLGEAFSAESRGGSLWEALSAETLGGGLAAEPRGGMGEGWCMVGYKGYPLGLGKLAGGMLKNHLPKALRAAKLS